jgi:hydrogenase maturation protease
MSGRRFLVAGVGNVFLGDDGFGVEVARRLCARPQPDGVDVVDFGIRGLDLAYALLDGYDVAVLVDATPRGGAPGTLYVIEPEIAAMETIGPIEAHDLAPRAVLALVRAMDGQLPVIRIVGCEPAAMPAEDMSMGLSAPVAAAVDGAVALVESLVTELRQEPVPGA